MDTSNTPELSALVDTAGLGLSAVVAGLRTSREVTNKIRYRGEIRELPSREAMHKLLQHLQAALFPTHYGHTDLSDETIDYFVGSQLNTGLDRKSVV